MKFAVDATVGFDEGGSAEFYDVLSNKRIGFKQFRNRYKAISAYKKQLLLSKHNLAPKIFGKLCQLPIFIDGVDTNEKTNWGFITEKAKLIDERTMKKRMKEIQELVETIYEKTGLKFWDCHYYNIGYIKRQNKAKLVCIDTGSESFLRDANAWGFNKPGPKCSECDRYQCICSGY